MKPAAPKMSEPPKIFKKKNRNASQQPNCGAIKNTISSEKSISNKKLLTLNSNQLTYTSVVESNDYLNN